MPKLPLGPSGLFAVPVADEAEGPGGGVHVYHWLKLKQTFVDGAEFFGTHVPIVDAGECLVGAEETEAPHGIQEPLVRNGCAVEIGALPGTEQPT